MTKATYKVRYLIEGLLSFRGLDHNLHDGEYGSSKEGMVLEQ